MSYENQRQVIGAFPAGKTQDGQERTCPYLCYVRITVEGSPRAEMSLGRKVYPDEWNQADECVMICAKNKDLALVNTTIKQYRAKLETDYFVLAAQMPVVTSQQLKSYFLGESPEKEKEKEKPKPVSLMDVVNFKLEQQKERADKSLLASATVTKWNTTKTKLLEFIQHKYEADDIPLENVNMTFADDLFHYFTVYDDLGENAAMKYISHLKQILKLAKGRWLERNPIEDFKCPYVQPDREALTMQELLKLHKRAKLEQRHRLEISKSFEDTYNLLESWQFAEGVRILQELEQRFNRPHPEKSN